MTLITVPFRLVTADHILKKVEKFPTEVQAIEVWINDWKTTLLNTERISAGVAQLRQAWKGKILIACKDKIEKGNWKGTVEEKIELLLAAAKAGADYVDMGFHHGHETIESLKKQLPKSCKLIVSSHDFKKTASGDDLRALVQDMINTGADVIKIATMVTKLADNESLLELSTELQDQHVPHVVIGMGEMGMITRTLGYKLGNAFDFVSFGSSTAPGQLTIEQAAQNSLIFQ